MRSVVGILGVLVALAALCPTAWTAAPARGTVNSWESYQGIVTGNIFSRDRQRGRSASQPSSRPGTPEWVLTGIASCGSAPVAFFEENQSGQVVWATVGTGVGGGEVLGFCLDSVNVRLGGVARCVSVGQNIRGESTSMPSATGGATSAPSGGGPSDVLERMRQRRLQEMK